MKRAKLLIGSVVALAMLVTGGLTLIPHADASDCSNNAVVQCGFSSISNLRDKYNRDATPGMRNIYSYFGLTSDVINHASYKTATVYKSGSIVVDGKTVATGAYSAGRYYINGSTKHTVGGTTFYVRSTTASFLSSSMKGIAFFNSKGAFIGVALYDCGNPVGGKPVPPPKPPVYSCTSLKAIEADRTTFNFITDAMAKDGAVIKNYTYNFGDGSTKTTGASTSHSYAKEGTYTVKVAVNISVNGKSVTAPTCTTKVTVKPAPVYACTSLKATQVDRTTFNFVTDATAKNGAAIKNYTYTFGDGSTQTTGASVKHSYTKVGTYTIKVAVNVTVNGKSVTAPTCTAKVTVKPEMCKIPGKEEYTKDDKRCVEDKPSVSIEKTVDSKEYEQVDINQQFEYEITVKNTGNTTLKNLKVTDPAPAGITMISADKGTISKNSWSYTIPSLTVGKSATFKIQAKYPAYEDGTQVNTACVDTSSITPTHPSLCDTASTSTHEDIQICDLNDSTVKTIDKGDYDESHETTDLSKCTPPTPTPTELPHTGAGLGIGSLIGAGSLTGVVLAYVASRRNLR